VAHNYQVARQFFSYAGLEGALQAIMSKPRLAVADAP
jgi:hypothetical protein